IGDFAHDHCVLVDVAAHRIASTVKLSRERMIHHRYSLRTGTVRLGNEASRKQGHLERLEITRSDIDPTRPTLVACLLAVAQGDPVVPRKFIREVRSNCNTLDSW